MDASLVIAFILGMVLVIFMLVIIKGLSLVLSGPDDFWDRYICNR